MRIGIDVLGLAATGFGELITTRLEFQAWRTLCQVAFCGRGRSLVTSRRRSLDVPTRLILL